MTTHFLTIADLPVSPWKNGGGTTCELLSWPLGFAAFDWRVSIATISTDGPFSTFAGVDRILTLVDGDGIRLHGSGVEHRIVDLYTPFEFDGSAGLDCELVGRRCTALNVMTRRGRGRAQVEVVTGPRRLPESISHGVLLGLAGDWDVGGHQVNAGSALWWAEQQQLWRLQPRTRAARLACIGWQPT